MKSTYTLEHDNRGDILLSWRAASGHGPTGEGQAIAPSPSNHDRRPPMVAAPWVRLTTARRAGMIHANPELGPGMAQKGHPENYWRAPPR